MSKQSLVEELKGKLSLARENTKQLESLDQGSFSIQMAVQSAKTLEELLESDLLEAERLTREAEEVSRLRLAQGDNNSQLNKSRKRKSA